jgi:hypothetical protein
MNPLQSGNHPPWGLGYIIVDGHSVPAVKRGFERARANAIRLTGAVGWGKAGAAPEIIAFAE